MRSPRAKAPERVATDLLLEELRRIIREEVERQLTEREKKGGPAPFQAHIHKKGLSA